ncbi:hypothetical protein NLS1_21730 [Nocardioides sp. LS1]|nr:hypothetical protein NLS1_21730 [Nocardioides sp. LS1]
MSTTASTDGPPIGFEASQLAMLARAWHSLSDHGRDGALFGAPICNCSILATRIARLLDWVTRDAVVEPTGLGAVITNPVTQEVFVRAGHPAYPWAGPLNPPEQWENPATGEWFQFQDLARPRLIQAAGWDPPTATGPASTSEPSSRGRGRGRGRSSWPGAIS